MNGLMPNTTTATELQRNFRKVSNKAKRLKQPLIVLSNNKPEAVLMDYEVFERIVLATKSGLLSISINKDKKKKSGIDKLFGSWSKEEADEFDRVIEDAFEKVNLEEWR